MKDNAVLDKALSLLTHPISLAALGGYALNLGVLQRLSLNWLTGKLGDFAWVFVAPFVLTALLAVVLPERQRQHAFLFSVLCIGFGFSLIKATALNTEIVAGLEKSLGSPISVVQDGSDLLALLALAATLWLWYHPQPLIKLKQPVGIFLIALLAMLTLADMAAPKLGITSVEFTDKAMLACAGYYGSFQSTDGGQTWEAGQANCETLIYSPQYSRVYQNPTAEKIRYRFLPGLIERSTDDGHTWQADYQWQSLSEAERLYYISSNSAYGSNDLPPYSAAIDPQSGNVFFAMGSEGLLKRAAGSAPNYTWVTVGNYKKIEYRKSDLIVGLLYGEWMLAIAAGGVGVALLDIKLKPNKFKTALIVLASLGMAACVIFFPPAPTSAAPYLSQFLPIGLSVLFLLMLILTVFALADAGEHSKKLLILSSVGFVFIALLSFVPFALWAYNIIPYYLNALYSASAIAILSVIALQLIASKWISFPPPPPPSEPVKMPNWPG